MSGFNNLLALFTPYCPANLSDQAEQDYAKNASNTDKRNHNYVTWP